MRRNVAERVNKLFLECFAKLDEVTAAIREHCSENERATYLRDIATINAEMLMALKPIYEVYPELMPPQLRTSER